MSGALSSDQLGRLAAGALSEESLDELLQDQGSNSLGAPELAPEDSSLVLPGSETPSESASEDALAASEGALAASEGALAASEAPVISEDTPEPAACVSSSD